MSVSAERASVSLLSGEEVGYLSSPGCRLLEHREIQWPEEVPRQREADPSRGKGRVHRKGKACPGSPWVLSFFLPI